MVPRGDNGARQELANSRSGAQRSAVVTGPTRTMVPARAGERTRTMSKPAPASAVDATVSHERVNAAKTQVTNGPSGSGGAPTRGNANSNAEAGGTQATVKGKNVVESKAGGEGSKPGWGRPAPRKPVTVGKDRKEKEQEQEKKGKETGVTRQRSRSRPQQPQQQRQKTKPESVPLPPSPGRPRPSPTPEPAQVPLPSSPSSEKAEQVASEVKSSEVVPTENTDMESKPITESTDAPAQDVSPQHAEEAEERQVLEKPLPSPPIPAEDSDAATPQPPTIQPDDQHGPTTPTPVDNVFSSTANNNNKSTSTPISSLFESIQRGFLMTPSSPLSPPQKYIARAAAAAGLAPGVPFKFTTPPLMRETGGLQFGLKPVIPIGLGDGGEEGARVALTDVGLNQ